MTKTLISCTIAIGFLGVALLWALSDAIAPNSVRAELYKITYQFFLLALIGGAGAQAFKTIQQKRIDETNKAAKKLEDKALDAAKVREEANQKAALTLEHQRAAHEKQNNRNRLMATQLFEIYGEFFAAWKLWNYYKHWEDYDREEPIPIDIAQLFDRANRAEGLLESLLANMAASMTLSVPKLEDLGRLRQAFQQLRERMRDDQAIPWYSSDDDRYAEFKRLVSVLGAMLCATDDPAVPDPAAAQAAWLAITSNDNEGYWDDHREEDDDDEPDAG